MYCKYCEKSTKQIDTGTSIFINEIVFDLYRCSICNKTNRKIRNDTILKFIREINKSTT